MMQWGRARTLTPLHASTTGGEDAGSSGSSSGSAATGTAEEYDGE